MPLGLAQQYGSRRGPLPGVILPADANLPSNLLKLHSYENVMARRQGSAIVSQQPSLPVYEFTPTAPTDVTQQSDLDTDFDNYTDVTEIQFGTDINDPTDFPVTLFNVFNNI